MTGMAVAAASGGGGMHLHAATDLAEKVAALSRADFYGEPKRRGDGNDNIVCVETHMSWVFLTPQYAYKLKKPVRSHFLDFSTLAAREHYCREELRLNRRLAPSAYLEVLPLRRSEGRLQLDGNVGEIVDYLIKMNRLPTAKMLDRVLAEHTLRRGDLRAVMATLTKFYRHAEKAPMTPAQYRARLTAAIDDNRAQLCAPHYNLPQAQIARITAMQLDYVATSDELAARATHVVDAHGDLRPEHIYLGEPDLGEPVQIIDCLEFQSELRKLDPVDELSFLALECARLGAPQVGNALLRMYRVLSRDRVLPMLIAFYQSHRALVRAALAIWHLDDTTVRDRERWYNRALTYIDFAERAIDRELPIGIGNDGRGR